ncbi:MAG: hypothetical protein D3908_04360 [Candidatus Electrothrix sp. AUS4]|nr:hypothetical protein [Candidatus Electrothrix sp. AUS4]
MAFSFRLMKMIVFVTFIIFMVAYAAMNNEVLSNRKTELFRQCCRMGEPLSSPLSLGYVQGPVPAICIESRDFLKNPQGFAIRGMQGEKNGDMLWNVVKTVQIYLKISL